MSKQYTVEQLSTMSLKELAALSGIASLVKVSKAKAVERTYAALPDVAPATATLRVKTWHWPTLDDAAQAAGKIKVGGYKARSKFGKLYAALAELRTRAELLAATGFDAKNLSVAMSIMKRDGHVIRVAVDTDKTYRYQVAA